MPARASSAHPCPACARGCPGAGPIRRSGSARSPDTRSRHLSRLAARRHRASCRGPPDRPRHHGALAARARTVPAPPRRGIPLLPSLILVFVVVKQVEGLEPLREGISRAALRPKLFGSLADERCRPFRVLGGVLGERRELRVQGRSEERRVGKEWGG